MGDKKWVVTIDGPAGSGKSTVAKRLAGKLNILYLDTGALYRAVAYKIRSAGITEPSAVVLRGLFAQTKISLKKKTTTG